MIFPGPLFPAPDRPTGYQLLFVPGYLIQDTVSKFPFG
jgi:hypothetical protein